MLIFCKLFKLGSCQVFKRNSYSFVCFLLRLKITWHYRSNHKLHSFKERAAYDVECFSVLKLFSLRFQHKKLTSRSESLYVNVRSVNTRLYNFCVVILKPLSLSLSLFAAPSSRLQQAACTRVTRVT